MSIKPNLTGHRVHALGGYTLLAAEGPDAEVFLQAQLMNDVRALAPMQWQWNGWLNAKGRVIALFALARLTPERFWLLLPDFGAGELLPLLQRYVFRSKVRLSVLDDWRVAAGFEANLKTAANPPDRIHGDDESGYGFDMGSDDEPRNLRLLPASHPALAPIDPRIDERWLAADIARGLPRLPASQREAWTPQMLSLERLRAFSLKKGCYPGQEIVARTHYLGQAKRVLFRLEGEGLEAGQDVNALENKLGSIVCATRDGRQALAVLSSGTDPASALTSASRPCRIQPLADGLARPG